MTQTDKLELAANTRRVGLRRTVGRVPGHRGGERGQGRRPRRWAWRGQGLSLREVIGERECIKLPEKVKEGGSHLNSDS